MSGPGLSRLRKRISSMSKIMSREQAAKRIKDGDTIMISGSGGGVMDADFVYEGVEKRFMETGHPRDLTLVHVTGIGNRGEKGVSRFAHEGMTRRVIGGHWGWAPAMSRLALDNGGEADNPPPG